MAEDTVASIEISQNVSQSIQGKSPEIPVTMNANENSANVDNPLNTNDTDFAQQMAIDNMPDEAPDHSNTKKQNADINNMETSTPNGADPQSSRHSTHEMPLPPWLSNMLGYLRSVSESVDWQNLVSDLVEFEKLNPVSGVRVILLNSLTFLTWITW